MIPILYESWETEFTTNGIGRLRDVISVTVTEERNGVFECDFEYPISGVYFDRIKLGQIITVKHDDTDDVQPFDIVSYSKPIDGVVLFHAVHISYRLSSMVTSGKDVNTIQSAFDRFALATPNMPFSFVTDKISTGYVAAFDGIPRSVRSLLGGTEGSLLDTYGGEYEFDKWTVKYWAERGVDRELIIRYGVNMIDYNEEVDYSDTFVGVVPFWAGTQTNGAQTIVTGKLIDSGERLYGNRLACVPLDLTDKFETMPTKAQLEEMARQWVGTAKPYLPQQSITVNFVRIADSNEYAMFSELEKCKLCDRIRVVFPDYETGGWFKIVRVLYDALEERFVEMELGTLQTSLAQALGIDSSQSATNGNSAMTPADQQDVIVEEGISGGWKYRKWANGKVEAWRSISFVSATPAAWASPVRYIDKSITFPVGLFDSAPTVIATSPSNQYWVVGCGATSAVAATLRFATVSQNAMTTSANFYAYTN